MSVVGIGTDIVHTPRISRIISVYGMERFLKRIFTGAEMAQARQYPPETLDKHVAGRIACKEAVFKALGSQQRLGWRDFSVLKVATGGLGAELPRQLRTRFQVHLSISHDGDYATAFAMAIDTRTAHPNDQLY